jgi:hypothetical protein
MVRGSNSPIWPAGTESLPNQALAQVLCHRYQLWTAMQHMQLFEEQGTLQRGTRTAEKRDTKLAKLGGFRPCRGLSSGI